MKTRETYSLNIGTLNCHGLKDKIDLPEMHGLVSSCDIFGTSETWLVEEDKKALKDRIDGFTFYPVNRTKGKDEKGGNRGGVGIFIKNKLLEHVKIRYDLSCENLMWCKLKKKFFGYRDDVYVGFVYFPPGTSTREKKLDIDQNHLHCKYCYLGIYKDLIKKL